MCLCGESPEGVAAAARTASDPRLHPVVVVERHLRPLFQVVECCRD